MFTLKASARDQKTKPAYLRRNGQIPAVFYGMKKESTSISLKETDFLKAWKSAGESTTVTLETPQGTFDTLIHDVVLDPLKGKPIHADFLIIDANKAIEVSVPLEFIGISDAVKTGVGILIKVLHELEVSALQKNLPQHISVDVSGLATLQDQISVSDLVLPTGVTAVTKGEEIVASIAEAKEEKEEEAVAVDLSAIEVEKKGKKEEEIATADEGAKS